MFDSCMNVYDVACMMIHVHVLCGSLYCLSEFAKDIPTENLAAKEGLGFLVVPRWVENENETEESDAGYFVNNDETLSTESDIDETEEFCTVTFKCIGVT